MYWRIYLFFINNYRLVTKSHCSDISNCSLYTRNSMETTTLASKKEHLFSKTSSGCLLKFKNVKSK